MINFHPRVGTGFTYESLRGLEEVQLPLSSRYRNELIKIDQLGIPRTVIAEICNVYLTY